jgi:hypothetical protein
MLEQPTKYPTYDFPLKSIRLKYHETGGYVEADIVQLTKLDASSHIDRVWWRFNGPFATPCEEPADDHWKWAKFVKRVRADPQAKCAAARTPDGAYQGAVIYRSDGVSLLEPNAQAVYGQFLATAPQNRPDYALYPLYRDVGSGLMHLAILESYLLGFGGRVSLYSLPSSLDFYKKLKFRPTGDREGDMIHVELLPETAITLLQDVGLI